MTVETFTDTAPDELNVNLPASGDSRTEGDNHLRNIKNVIKTTFANVSGPVTSSEAELNYVDITSLGTWQAGKALTAAATSGAISCANLAMTNINIDSGDITGVSYAGGTVTGSLTWNAAQNLNSQALTNVNIDSGDIAAAVTGATASARDNDTSLATTAYVDREWTGNASPSTGQWYDSGWFNVTSTGTGGSSYAKSHGLGAVPDIIIGYIAENADGSGIRLGILGPNAYGIDGTGNFLYHQRGTIITATSSSQITLRTGYTSVAQGWDNSGNQWAPTSAYVRLLCKRII